MSRAGDFVDRTLPVESKMRAKARGRLFRIRLQCGRCDSITDQSGTTPAFPLCCCCALPTPAARGYFVPAMWESPMRRTKFRQNLKREGSKRRNIAECRSKRGNQGMIEIILTVCAIANPANCEDKHLQFAWEGSIRQCMMAAQPYIAEWIGRHPEWMARKWTCDYPGHEKRDI
jgi:hypothetical protein